MPIDQKVVSAMTACLNNTEVIGNPSSLNNAGRNAMHDIEIARQKLANLLHTNKDNLTWTSGATESNNLAIIGAARFRSHLGRHIITMATEHKAVLGAFDYLEKEGFQVTRLIPDSNGLLKLADLKEAIKKETQLVSIMHVNNETGVTQDIVKIGSICREKDILFHTDAAQSIGKISLNLDQLPIDLLSISAHKFYGPQGIGALYMRKAAGCGVIPLHYGGEQEKWIRPGTLPVHQIIGFGVAAELALERSEDDYLIMQDLHKRLWDGLKNIPGIEINGTIKSKYPGILNVSISGVDGESLILLLEPLCVANGSACNSKNNEPSFVLKALGRSDLQAQSAIRFSFNRNTTHEEIDITIEKYHEAVRYLREIAPDELV
jgi:cysteine desulfurase